MATYHPLRPISESIRGWGEVDAMEQRRQMNELAMQDQMRNQQEDNALRQFLRSNPDWENPNTAFQATAISPKGGMALAKIQAEVGKEKALTSKAEREAKVAELDQIAKVSTEYMKAMPVDPAAIPQWIQAGMNHPILGPRMKTYGVDPMTEFQSVQGNPVETAKWMRLKQAGYAEGMAKIADEMDKLSGRVETGRHNIQTEKDTAARDAAMERDRSLSRGIQIRGQNMVDDRTRELAALRQQELDAGKIDKAEVKRREQVDKSVTDYSKTLQKEGIPDFEEALATVEDKLSKYKKGSVPGVGRGVGLVPDWLQGQEAEDMTNAIAAVKNVLLKSRSGSAVSESELRRLVQEIGTGGFRSEATVRKAIERVRNRFDKVKENAVAGVTDEVKTEYEKRGGVPITRGTSKTSTSDVPSGIDPEDWKYMSDEDKKKWKR